MQTLVNYGFNIIFYVGGPLMCLAFPCCWLAGLTLGRKYDKLFKKYPAGILDPQLPIVSKFFYRPFVYMNAIILGKKCSDRPKLGLLYGDYDFRANANKFDIALSWFFVYIISTGLIFIAILFVILQAIAKIMHIPVN